MKHLFVPYELALLLKEKGFDKECLAVIWSDNDLQVGTPQWVDIMLRNYKHKDICKTPLYQQVTDWLREKHNMSLEITLCWLDTSTGPWENWGYSFMNIKTCKRINGKSINTVYEGYYETYEKAIEEALKLI